MFPYTNDSVYKDRIKEDIFDFIKQIDGLDKEIYLNYVDGIEGYKIEPLIFQGQKDNLKDYKVTAIEKLYLNANKLIHSDYINFIQFYSLYKMRNLW